MKMFLLILFLFKSLIAKVGIEIDNPFMPWNVSGIDECDDLWKPNLKNLKPLDYVIIEDDLNFTKTLVQVEQIKSNEIIIKWSIYHRKQLVQNYFLNYNNNGVLIKLTNEKNILSLPQQNNFKCTISSEKKFVHLLIRNENFLTEFYTINKFSDSKNMEKVYVWKNSDITSLTQTLQIKQINPIYYCESVYNCKVKIEVRTTKVVDFGNLLQNKPKI